MSKRINRPLTKTQKCEKEKAFRLISNQKHCNLGKIF